MCVPYDNTLWNGSEEDGNVRSECEKNKSADCQMGTLTLISKGSENLTSLLSV
jgi:hypothetical protein